MSRLQIFGSRPGPPGKTGDSNNAKSGVSRSSAGMQMPINKLDEAASKVLFSHQCKRTWMRPRTTGHLSSCGQKEEDIYIFIFDA